MFVSNSEVIGCEDRWPILCRVGHWTLLNPRCCTSCHFWL